MSSETSKNQHSSGLRAWRLKFKGAFVEHIVVFDPSEQESELDRRRVRLWKVHEREFGWFDRRVRERLESLPPEIRARSIEQYIDWKDTRNIDWKDARTRTIVHCFKCRTEWTRGTEKQCQKCSWDRCPSSGACGCDYEGEYGN